MKSYSDSIVLFFSNVNTVGKIKLRRARGGKMFPRSGNTAACGCGLLRKAKKLLPPRARRKHKHPSSTLRIGTVPDLCRLSENHQIIADTAVNSVAVAFQNLYQIAVSVTLSGGFVLTVIGIGVNTQNNIFCL